MLKICYNCKQNLNLAAFSADKSKHDGLSIYCRECKKIKKAFRLALGLDLEADRIRYWVNPEAARAKWRRLNPPEKEKIRNSTERVRKRKRIYQAMRRASEMGFRVLCQLRTRINNVMRGVKKSEPTEALLGCSLEQFLDHLKTNFWAGMTWENYGKWHIDHIKPCASFDLSNPQQQRECFNYKNLQPLWAQDNLIKGSKIAVKGE